MKYFPCSIILVACWFGDAAVGEDWFRFRGPQLNGVSSETGWSHRWPADGPQTCWRAEVGTGFSSVSVSENRVYTIGNADNVDTVYCLDARTGQPLWSHSYQCATDANEFEGGPTSTPTVDGKFVYVLSRRGDVFAFEKASGTVAWNKNVADQCNLRIPTWGFAGSPLVIEDLLLLNAGDAGVALEKQTGKLVWASDDKDAGYSSMVPCRFLDGTSVVFGSSRSYVAVDPATGEELWRQRWLTTFGCNAADPIVSGSNVFLSSGYNRGSALLDLAEDPPAIVWKHKDYQNQLSTSVLIDGYLYGATGDVASGAKLACMELASGELQWTEDSIRVGGISAAGNRLIILSDSGELTIVEAAPSGFKLLASHSVLQGKCWTAPVLSGDRIYCRSADGQLVCVDVRKGSEE